MADAIYPLFSDAPAFSFQGSIEATVYTFQAKWNKSDGYWYLDILDETESVAFVQGRKILPIGPWLQVAARDSLPLHKILQLYDLSQGTFAPGAMIAVSSQPLQAPLFIEPPAPLGVGLTPAQILAPMWAAAQQDAAAMQLNYYGADTIASGVLP